MKIECIEQYEGKLQICEKNCISWIEIKDITHLICDGYITNLFLSNKERITVSKLLKRFEEKLTGYGFARVNRNTIVNKRHISKISFSKTSRFVFVNDTKIKISRRRLFL